MKKKTKIIFVTAILLFLICSVTGCFDVSRKIETKYYDGNNIMVRLIPRGIDDNDELQITILRKGNYTLYLSYIGSNKNINSVTLNFQVCDIPYQYIYEAYQFRDFEIVVLQKS